MRREPIYGQHSPQRIQRKRTKGYRMPPNTVSVSPLSYDERVGMLRLADDLADGDIGDLDTQQICTIIRALRRAVGEDAREDKP